MTMINDQWHLTMWHLHRQVMTLTMLLAQKIIETLISYRSNSRWNFLLWEQRRKEPTASWKYKTRKDLSIRAYINAFMPVYLRLFNNQILLSYLSYWVIKGCSYSKEKSVESIWIKAIWCQNVHSAKFVILAEKAEQPEAKRPVTALFWDNIASRKCDQKSYFCLFAKDCC